MRILASPAFSNEKVNPYNSLLYRELERLNITVEEYNHTKAAQKFADIVHFHWPDSYINRASLGESLVRMLFMVVIVYLLKLKGSKLVWTVHNIAPHDAFQPGFSRRFMQWFILHCDGFIFMSEANKAEFYQRFLTPSESRCAIIPHGHYRSCYPQAIGRLTAKKNLGLNPEKKVILFIGMIKPYKNIDGLMQVFNEAALEGYQLVIAGAPDVAYPELRFTLAKLKNSDTTLFLRFIPDNELADFMSAADVVVLPYKNILNSGALLLALSYNRPAIAPHMGVVADLQSRLGRNWIYSYVGGLTASSLQHALIALEHSGRPEICPLDDYSWDKIAAKTLDFYRQLSAPKGTVTVSIDAEKTR